MKAGRASQQLPLALAYAPQLGRDTFVPGPSNSAALRLIEAWPDWPSPAVLLIGPDGSGKSHLAHIWAERANAPILEAAGLSAATLPAIHAGSAFAIEDADAGPIPEAALFHVMNRVKEVGASLLMTARAAAQAWPIGLPDLRSRLRLATPVTLGPPDEALLRVVLVKLFADRQLIVDKPVIDYLIVRMERSLSFAASLVRALDVAALAAGRRVSRSMAAEILAELNPSDREFADWQ